MFGPATNCLHDYEAGWLTLLVEMHVATKEEAQAAISRVVQESIDQMEANREKRCTRCPRKKRPE